MAFSSTALAIYGLIIAAASTAVTVSSAQAQASAQRKQADYQATVARNNAIAAEYKAKDAEERGKIAAREQQVKTRQARANFIAVAAGRGGDPYSGTNIDIQGDISALGKLDELTIRNNAEREALGFRTAAQSYTGEQSLYTAAGQNARTAGAYATAGTALTGIGNVADKWYNYNRAGVFNSNGLKGRALDVRN